MKLKTAAGESLVLTKKGPRRYPVVPRRKTGGPRPPTLASVEIDSIRSARGLFAGSRLTAALLARRAQERRRG